MKYIRKFDSVADMTAALASSTISVLGMAMNGNTPVINNKEVAPTIPNDEVWYTSSDGNIIDIYEEGFEPLTVVSNIYSNGKGVVKLSGELNTMSWAFAESNLTSIILPSSVTSIDEEAFSDCGSLTSIDMPSSVTTIGDNAFYGCTGLTSITIGNSVTTIGNRAFENCSFLTSITIPNSVTNIGTEVFSGCTSLSHIVVDSSNQKYDNRNDCNAIIETASNTLVYGCKNTVIPNTITTIGDHAFKNQTSLTDITIPNSVITIGFGAFINCRGLVTLTVPNTVTTIRREAFLWIPNVIYSGNATDSPWGANTINGCVDGDFVYTDNTKTNLVDYVGNGGSIIIPDTVTTLNRDIFSHVTVTSITFGNNVSEIPEYMFSEKVDLISVTINNGIVGEYSFVDCANLTSLIIGNGVTSIGNGGFGECTGLTSITIPSSVTNIGGWAFNTCTSLISITCNATTPPVLGTEPFDNTNDCPIYVPSGSVEAYKTASNWSTYASRIQAIPAN